MSSDMDIMLGFLSELAIWFGTITMLACFVIGLVFANAFKLTLTNRLNLMTGGVMLALFPYLLTLHRSSGSTIVHGDGLLLMLFSFVLFCLGIRLLLLSLVIKTP